MLLPKDSEIKTCCLLSSGEAPKDSNTCTSAMISRAGVSDCMTGLRYLQSILQQQERVKQQGLLNSLKRHVCCSLLLLEHPHIRFQHRLGHAVSFQASERDADWRRRPALEDGLVVYGAVMGSAVNQDGRSSSLTAPHGPSQQNLIAAALEDASLGPRAVEFVALHGTGTPLGDPIEVGAVGKAFGRDGGSAAGVLSVGSNKACYGHTEGTAGVTGALLALTSLNEAAHAPIVNLRSTNPYVEAALSSWRVAADRPLASLPRQAGPSPSSVLFPVAGTSSFGMSGVNAHAFVSSSASRERCMQTSPIRPQLWHRSRTWPAPPPITLLAHVRQQRSQGKLLLTGEIRLANLSYLWDHRVMGRPLLPASALFDTAHQTAVLLTDNTAALAGRATILAPFILPEGNEARTLVCEVDTRTWSIDVKTSQHHLRSSACTGRSSSSGRAPPVRTKLITSKLLYLSQQFRRSLSASHHPRVVPQLAKLALPVLGTGYGLHPAVGDCTIHLGAVQQSQHPTRIPVSLEVWRNGGLRNIPARMGWAFAESRSVDTDGTATNGMRCCLGADPAGAQIENLVAKVVQDKRVAVALDNIKYVVQWQMAIPTPDASPSPPSRGAGKSSKSNLRWRCGTTSWWIGAEARVTNVRLQRCHASARRESGAAVAESTCEGVGAAASFQLQYIQVQAPA